MTPARRELLSAARSVVVGPFATLLFVLNLDLGASANVDCPKLFSRSWIRGVFEVADLAGLPDVVEAAETLGFSERVALTEGLGCPTVLVVDLVLDSSPDEWWMPPPGNGTVRFGAWLDEPRFGARLDTTRFDSELVALPNRDVFECFDVRLALGRP